MPGGIPVGSQFRPVPRLGLRPNRARDELTVLGNFVEVWPAKEGHDGPVGVNYMEKIQLATQPAAYGAMLAGVDHVLMGAGIPGDIPGLLDALSTHSATELTVAVEGSQERHTVAFDPTGLAGPHPERLARPRFLAIVASTVLARYLHRSPVTRPDGFVLETHRAGGHSAPPRRRNALGDEGEPVYGPRDAIDIAKVAALGLAVLARGRQGHAGGSGGGEGRGRGGRAGRNRLRTGPGIGADPRPASEAPGPGSGRNPAGAQRPLGLAHGFPFKVARVPDTLSDEGEFALRPRLCDLGYLRTPFRKGNGTIGYRCPAEPVDAYVRKGGEKEDTDGRRCLCNALTANVGLQQHRPDGHVEPPLLTLGQDLDFLPDLLSHVGTDFSAADVIDHLLSKSLG